MTIHHYRLIKTDDILSGPVDYSTPVGNTAVFICSKTVRSAIESSKPKTKKFTANLKHNRKWLDKFNTFTDANPDFVVYKKAKSGMWYAQAVFL